MRGVNSIAAVLQWKRYGRKAVYTASILLFALSAFTIFPLSFDEDSADAASGPVSSETIITLVSTSNVASVDLAVDNIAGTFASSTSEQEAAFSVYTNNYTGYTLSVSSEDNTGRLLNNAAYMESISSAVTAESFDNTSNNNKWGFRPSSYVDRNDTVVSNTGNDALFLPAPTSVATALDVTTEANMASGSRYSIALGARADINIPEGTYTGTFNLVATGNPVPYIISYDKNTNDTVTNMPLSEANAASSATVQVSDKVPVRSGYRHKGWCTVQPVWDNGADYCLGDGASVLWPGSSFGIDLTAASNGIELYAMWQTSSSSDKLYIQDVTDATCPTEQTLVYDKRDEKPYFIQKITANGVNTCWMTTNLDLAAGTTLDSETSNLEEGTTYTLPESNESGFNMSNAVANVYNSNNTICGNRQPCYSYYSYPVATAGINPIGTQEKKYDICPKGWHLPSEADAKNLAIEYYSGRIITRLPWNGADSRGYTAPVLSNSEGAYYWLSGHYYFNDDMTMILSYSGDNSAYVTAFQKGAGAAIRCVAAKTTPRYIQDVDASNCPTEKTLVYDKRDEKPYYVQKFMSGGPNGDEEHCWMVSDLDIDGGTELTSELTNLKPGTTYTLPASSLAGFNDNDVASVYNTGNDDCDLENPCHSYYNYVAATAGKAELDQSGYAQYDICPKGWQLPSSTQSLSTVTYIWGTDNNPFDYTSVGYIHDGAFQGLYNSGYLLAYRGNSTGENEVYQFYVSSGNYSYSNVQNSDGYGIRCKAIDGEKATFIQDVTNDTCPTAPKRVYDRRDGEIYTIQKLADGNCWMLDNLRLNSYGVSGRQLYPGNTNMSPDASFALPDNDADWSTSGAHVNANYIDFIRSYGDGESKNGAYYNYCAATAGTVCSDSYDNDPLYDICPKGWHMPTSGANGEYQALYSAYNSNFTDYRNALHLVLSGYIDVNGTASERGVSGRYWSSNYDNNYLFINGSSFSINSASKREGLTIRCVAKTEERIYIQDVHSNTCPTEPTIVYDRRDGNKYTIQKLNDGKCWMLDNLRLGSEGDITLTQTYSNVTSEFTLPASTSENFGSLTVAQINTESENDEESYGSDNGKVGTYYNYCAASAGTICGDNNFVLRTTQDICPSGWRMPTGGDDGEYQALVNSYSGFENAKNALRSPLSGYYYGSSANHQGSYGSFWSSTGDGDNHIYSLDVRADSVYPDYSSNRDSGLSVRCVAKDVTSEVTYIQDIANGNCPTIPITVYDNRDYSAYVVQKLADGKCWLLDNLRLDSNSVVNTISSDNTNLPSGRTFTMPETIISGDKPSSFTVPYTGSSKKGIKYGGEYDYGVTYNFCAASAGTFCYSSGTTGAVNYDICPKGWRMATASLTSTMLNLYKDSSVSIMQLLRIPSSSVLSDALGETGGFSFAESRGFPANTGVYVYSYRGNTYNFVSGDRSYYGYIRCVANRDTVPVAKTVRYNANGGTGTMTDVTGVDFSTVTAASNGFTRTGFEFTGWNTAANGSGTSVAEGGSLQAAATAMGVADGGILTLYAQWSPVYSISYDGNNSDAGTMTNVHNNVQIDDSIGLIASNYSRAGYGFIGWSTDADAATKFTNGQNVTIYGPNEEVTIDSAFLANADSNRNVTLYAVWLAQNTTKTMQSFTTAECTAMSAGDIIALKDTRDNEVYAVSKLADNHCWMIENLRLNPATANITTDNTNGPAQDFLDNVGSSASATTLCGSNSAGAECINTISYNLNNLNRSLTASYNNENNSSSWYSYGGMYNWYTATAGNGTYSTTSGSVTGDICPTGWRLPTGGGSGEMRAFNKAVNNNTEVTGDDAMLKVFPNNMVYGGDYNRTAAGGRGRYLRYQTSTAYSSPNAYRFGAEKTNVTPQKYYNKWAAFAVRCIVK